MTRCSVNEHPTGEGNNILLSAEESNALSLTERARLPSPILELDQHGNLVMAGEGYPTNGSEPEEFMRNVDAVRCNH